MLRTKSNRARVLPPHGYSPSVPCATGIPSRTLSTLGITLGSPMDQTDEPVVLYYCWRKMAWSCMFFSTNCMQTKKKGQTVDGVPVMNMQWILPCLRAWFAACLASSKPMQRMDQSEAKRACTSIGPLIWTICVQRRGMASACDSRRGGRLWMQSRLKKWSEQCQSQTVEISRSLTWWRAS